MSRTTRGPGLAMYVASPMRALGDLPQKSFANVAELVDALDLGSSGATRGSSTLPIRTSVAIPTP